MADENNTNDNTDTLEATPPADVAPPKKRRGPRPKNVPSEATSEMPAADAAQPTRGRRKQADATVSAKTQAGSRGKAKDVAKGGVRKTRAAKGTAEAPAPVLDDIADLLQLEEENARLRKALAEKLRAENADLRKRLGLA